MNILDSFRQRISRLLSTPKEELGGWARLLRFQIHLWRFCAKRLRSNNAMAMSAALSFRTMFAMIPVLVLAFLVLKPLGVIENNKMLLREFMDESGLSQITYQAPATTMPDGEVAEDGGRTISVADQIETMIDRVEGQLTVGRLGPVGVILLVWTALALLTTMERSLNRIFEAPRSRSLTMRVIVYWSIVTLGPVVLVAAGYVCAKAADVAGNIPVLSWMVGSLGWLGPILMGVMLLAGLYRQMPNTEVRLRPAVEGALVAVPLWLVGRWAFAIYVEHVGSQSVYGAIGLVPLFLMWLNVSWLIFLFGAEVAHVAANISRMQWAERAEKHILGPWDVLATVVAVAHGQLRTGGGVHIENICEQLAMPEEAVSGLLAELTERGLLCRVADRGRKYVLARPADRMVVTNLLGFGESLEQYSQGSQGAAQVVDAISQVRSRSEAGLGNLTVADILTDV